MSADALIPPLDPDRFLSQQLPRQNALVARYAWGDASVWLKRAGPRHGMAGYRVLGLLAGAMRLEVLRPIPNRGGREAIAIEVQRLRDLEERGLRVPQVLAAQPDGFLMEHLGGAVHPLPALADELQEAVPQGATSLIPLWWQGLCALSLVHRRGTCLSQAFARNLVRCPDGVVGYIDFEDDPLQHLPLAQCQARDALCYVQSTALYLLNGRALQMARPLWLDWLGDCAPPVREALRHSIARMAWTRHLPASRRLGRDLQRTRAAYELLHLE